MAEQQKIEKPKRAKSSYMHFCDEQRPAVMEANRKRNSGKVKMPELGKELSEMWSKLSAAEKAKYEALAADGKAKHEAAKQEYVESRQIEGLMKKPQCAYFQFINASREKIAKEHQLSSLPAVGKKAAELWNAMPAQEKKPYEEKYEAEKKAYDAWRETPEGKEALEKLKAQKQESKEAARQKSDGKRAAREDEDPDAEGAAPDSSSPKAKRGRKRAAPGAEGSKAEAAAKGGGEPAKKSRRKPKEAGPTGPELPAAVLQQCEKMGSAESGVSFRMLLEKLLQTRGLVDVSPEKALKVLEKHGGLLNKARSELGGA